jgi:hypothetical protein
VQRIDVESVRPESLIYALMPDLPRLFNDGPIRANISLINNGNIFLQTRSEISVDRLKIFSGFNREELFRDNLEELLLVPGQVGSGQKLLVNEIVGSEKVADALPGIGIFQIKVKTSGTIGSDVLAELNEGVWFVIFPWKPFFLIFLLFIVILIVQKQRLINSPLAVRDDSKIKSYQQQDQWAGDIIETLIANNKKEEKS